MRPFGLSKGERTVGPLQGIKIVELAGIGPGPFSGMLLSDMGADIIRVDRAQQVNPAVFDRPNLEPMYRGRRSIGVDLKNPDGVEAVLRTAANRLARDAAWSGVDCQGGTIGLRRIAPLRRGVGCLGNVERRDVLFRLHQEHRAGNLPHGALDFRMPGMPDQNDGAALPGVAAAVVVHLGDQRTGRIDHAQPTRYRFALHVLGSAL